MPTNTNATSPPYMSASTLNGVYVAPYTIANTVVDVGQLRPFANAAAHANVSAQRGYDNQIQGIAPILASSAAPVMSVSVAPMPFANVHSYAASGCQPPPLSMYGSGYLRPPTAMTYVHPTNHQFAGVARQLQDLPVFDGRCEDWPMFEAAYNNSTAAYNYSNFENSQWLNKSLKGEGKETVSSLLIYAENVGAVMDQLRFHFGRPEQLIGSQLGLVRDIAPINENAIQRIVPFANKARNLAVFLLSLISQQHIASPTLLEELVNKLPMSKRMDWAKHAMQIQPYASLIDFSNWICDIANLICTVQSDRAINTTDAKRRVVLHADNDDKDKHVKNKYNNCSICKGNHKHEDCKNFRECTVDERWELAKKLKLCFFCLGVEHVTRDCKKKKICNVDGCRRSHHKLLHAVVCNAKVPKSPQDNVENSTDEPTVLSCKEFEAEEQPKLLFRVLPVTLHNCQKKGRHVCSS